MLRITCVLTTLVGVLQHLLKATHIKGDCGLQSCESVQLAFGISASLSFAFIVLSIVCCVAVAIDLRIFVAFAIIFFMLSMGTLAAAVIAAAWLNFARATAIVASICMGLMMLLSIAAMWPACILIFCIYWQKKAKFKIDEDQELSNGCALHWLATLKDKWSLVPASWHPLLFNASVVAHVLLASGADIDQAAGQFRDEETALWIAAYFGDTRVVKSLIQNGADVDKARAKDKTTPLYVAVHQGHFDIVEQLLGARADIELCTSDNESPLWAAAHYERPLAISKLLLLYASSPRRENRLLCINKRADDGTTPLFHAAYRGNSKLVNLLLHYGADVSAATAWMEIDAIGAQTAVHAAITGYIDWQNAKLSGRLKASEPPMSDHLKIFTSLLAKSKACTINSTFEYNGAKRTALYIATANRDIVGVQELLNHEADVNAADEHMQAPIWVACDSGHDEMVRLLLRHNAKPRPIYNCDYVTPLHAAAKHDTAAHARVARTLLDDAGVSPNCVDLAHETPLHYVARYANIAMANVLLCRRGVDRTITNIHNQTYRDVANIETRVAFDRIISDHSC